MPMPIPMFSYSLLMRKILNLSGRYGMGKSKHERKVFLCPETGIGSMGRSEWQPV